MLLLPGVERRIPPLGLWKQGSNGTESTTSSGDLGNFHSEPADSDGSSYDTPPLPDRDWHSESLPDISPFHTPRMTDRAWNSESAIVDFQNKDNKRNGPTKTASNKDNKRSGPIKTPLDASHWSTLAQHLNRIIDQITVDEALDMNFDESIHFDETPSQDSRSPVDPNRWQMVGNRLANIFHQAGLDDSPSMW